MKKQKRRLRPQLNRNKHDRGRGYRNNLGPKQRRRLRQQQADQVARTRAQRPLRIKWKDAAKVVADQLVGFIKAPFSLGSFGLNKERKDR